MSRTTGCRHATGETGKRALNVVYDGERHGQCLTSVLSRHGNRRIAVGRLHEGLELESERLPLGRVELDSFDERLERLRALRVAHERKQIDIPTQTIELARAGREIQ